MPAERRRIAPGRPVAPAGRVALWDKVGGVCPGTRVKARFADNDDGIENEQALLLRDVKPSRIGDLVPGADVAAAAVGEESEEETGWAGIYAARFR